MSFSRQTQEGGTSSFKVGSLKRRLPAVIIARIDPGTVGGTGVITRQLVLKNLNGDLKCQIAASFSSPTDGSPLLPAVIPAGFATIQLTPVVNSPNAGKLYLRPVFQDPTAAANQNHPLPQDLPFGWEFSTEADEVYMDFTINTALINTSGMDGQIVLQVTVEYDGEWWSTEAIKFALSQVQVTGTGATVIGTSAG